MKCEWCDAMNATETHNTVYWEVPDGTKAVQINETPCISCRVCGMEYQEEQVIKQIEDQLLLIDTKQLPKQLTYEELLSRPRLLKRNYFDFSV